jgi:F-type H+-transporting ATPase subunit a
MADSSAGKWAKRIFPLTGTIFLLVFTANMVKLLPGFESIGYLKEAHGTYGFKAVELIPGVIWGLDKNQDIKLAAAEESQPAESAATSEEEHAEEVFGFPGAKEVEPDKYYEVVPFLRGSATDLNFTLALAISTVFMVQVYGVMALGPGYFNKFFQFNRLVNGGPFGIIDFGVGFLEIILELAKVLSFAFRLFGNIFAGALLLSIVGALTAVGVPAGLYIFEVFFGIIQAYVFSLLALMFASGATVSHHGEEHHEEPVPA